jgi:GNAT superfamily N-acetyltransferase
MAEPTPLIQRLDAAGAKAALPELTALLQDAVRSGASLGFLHPLTDSDAAAYWKGVLQDLAADHRLLLVATTPEGIVGTVQLELAQRPNASHRAEVQKLFVASKYRGRGLGRALMEALDPLAREHGRTLLILDTREGDAAERLYAKLGWSRAGRIPNFARSSAGPLTATVFFYRELPPLEESGS